MGEDVGGGVSVAVGKGVKVARGASDAVGVAVGAGENVVHGTKKERIRKEKCLREKVFLFCMGCILPLVDKFTNKCSRFPTIKTSCQVVSAGGSNLNCGLKSASNQLNLQALS